MKYDERNYIWFEDIGRVETTSTEPGRPGVIWDFRFGTAVRFHVVRNGVKRETRQYNTVIPEVVGLSSYIEEMRYADADHVWVMCDLGRNAGGASRLNLATLSFDRSYDARDVVLSPDGRHVAWEAARGSQWAVFVDDMMVYPEVSGGFEGADLLQVRRNDGKSAWDIAPVPEGQVDVRRKGWLCWETTETLARVLVVEKASGTTNGLLLRAAMPSVSKRDSGAMMTVAIQELTTTETQQVADEIEAKRRAN